MSDYAKLEKVAEAAIRECVESDQRWPEGDDWFEPDLISPEMDYIKAANPALILALLAENEALRKDYEQAWEKAQALQSECDEFAKDAERYRWLRREGRSHVVDAAPVLMNRHTGMITIMRTMLADEQIDALIAQDSGQ